MTQYDINFREYWRILKKRRTLVIFVTIIFSIFFTIFAYLKAPTPIYTTDCLIEFERSPAIEDFYGKFDPSATDEIETQMTMVKSYTVFEKVVEKLALIPQKDVKGNGHLRDQVIATIENLRAKVEVEREGGSAILMIRVTDTDAAFTQTLTNAIALAYKETHAEQQTRRNTEQLKYIVSQLENVRKRLRDAENELNRFTKENELISIDLQSEKLLVKSEDIETQILKLEEDNAALDSLLSRLENFIENPFGPDHNFYSTAANAQYQGTNDAMVGLILKRDTLLQDFTPKHPGVMAISAKIIENAKKMSFLLQTQIMAIQKKETDLKKNLKKVDRQIKVLMEKRLEFDRLKRKVDRYDEMMVLLDRKNQEALIKKAEKPEIVNIVKPALLPTHPINSRNTASAGVLSVVIGVVLGFVIAFIVETFDTSLGAIEEVEETLGTKVLGVIPQGDTQDIHEELLKRDPDKFKNYSTKHTVGVISHFFPKSMVAESFRALRTNIQYKDPDKKAKTLAVTSSSPEEGKSMVASNLAITMAQGGMKTLLVGSDLRKPGIDKAFGVDRTPGLSDILIGDHPWRDTVKTVTDIMLGNMSRTQILLTPGLDHLHIITSGTPPQNPAELIDSKRLEEFIEEVKKEYDVIIFDSSPILSTADAAILGTKVDGVLLVYRVGSISKGLLKRTASQLEQVQCNLMGVVVNGINPDISPDFQGYKYYKYYYSYGESKNNKSIGEGKRHIKSPLLMYAAIACLSMGFLWQSGLIASFKRSIRGTPQPVPVSSGIEFRKKIVKMDMPTSAPTLISKTILKPEEKTLGVNVPPTQAPAEQALAGQTHAEQAPRDKPSDKMVALVSTLLYGKANRTDLKEKTTAVNAPPEKAPALQAPAEQTLAGQTPQESAQQEKPSDKMIALVSALLYGTANRTGLYKPAVHEIPSKHSYSLQLGAYRNLKGAKAAVATYREKGIFAYWSGAELNGNKRWFRVYTGSFNSPGEARTYREENNLLKAIIKKAPYNASFGSHPGEMFPSILKTPKPVSKKTGTNGSGNHEQDVASPMSEPIPPQAIKPKRKAPAERAPLEQASQEISKNTVTPKVKAPLGQAQAKHTPLEVPLTENVSQFVIPAKSRETGREPGSRNPRDDNNFVDSGSRYAAHRSSGMTDFTHYDEVSTTVTHQEKPPVEVPPQFSGPLFRKASISDLKNPEIHEANPKYPFSIQLGAFRTLVESQNAVSVYREKGISAYWSEVDLDGNERWFRVHTGFFETREEARKYEEEQNLVRSIVKETPYSTLIGTHRNRDELETKTLLLNDLGYMPYAIEDQAKKYRLFVGAFVTKQGAEEQRRILESKGIQSQVIRR